MSQFTLEPEEDQMLLDALRTHATQYQAMFGSEETAMLALIAKLEGQLPQPEPEDLNEPTDEEVEAHFAAVEAAATAVVEPEVAVEASEDDEQK
jgi:hypothetical protein